MLVGGSPAWRLPKIERDRDQSRRSQAAPPRRPGGTCGPDPVALHRRKKEQGREASKGRFDLTYAPPSKDTGCCSRQLNRTRPGECRVCCGFLALRDGCGTGLEATNDNSRWVRRESCRREQGSAAAASGSDSRSGSGSGAGGARSRKGPRRRWWAGCALLGVPSRSHWPVSLWSSPSSCAGREEARDQVCVSTRSGSRLLLLHSQICWLRYVEGV